MSDSLQPLGLYNLPGFSVHVIFQARVLQGCHFLYGDLPDPGIEPVSPVFPALAYGFFITEPPGGCLWLTPFHLQISNQLSIAYWWFVFVDICVWVHCVCALCSISRGYEAKNGWKGCSCHLCLTSSVLIPVSFERNGTILALGEGIGGESPGYQF